MRYVMGLMFANDLKGFLAIKKKDGLFPGFVNGIGGKVAEGETPQAAMVRKAKEDASLTTVGWTLFHKEQFENGNEVFYFALKSDTLFEGRNNSGDELLAVPMDRPTPDTVPNLGYLIPMALTVIHQLPHQRPVVSET